MRLTAILVMVAYLTLKSCEVHAIESADDYRFTQVRTPWAFDLSYLEHTGDPPAVINDVPDELKLSPDQQKVVDSFAPPLSAIAVTCNGMALSLFIQLDADHLFRADPRQSDMFTNVKGKMVQSKAPPMEWKVAYALAERAVLSSHVIVPCADGPAI